MSVNLNITQFKLTPFYDDSIKSASIVDETYESPFARFYQLCKKSTARPTELAYAFEQLPKHEQENLQKILGQEIHLAFFNDAKFDAAEFIKRLDTDYLPVIAANLPEGEKKLQPSKLVKALSRRDAFNIASRSQKIYDSLKSSLGGKIAYQLIMNCPLASSGNLDQRGEILQYLQKSQSQLALKHPGLFKDSSSFHSRAWKGQEMHYLLFSNCLGKKELEHFDYFQSVIEELINGSYDSLTIEIILDRLLLRESFHPFVKDLTDEIKLLANDRITKEQIGQESLKSVEVMNRRLFVTPSIEDRQTKFKPLWPDEASNEAFAYRCDRALGLGMTSLTRCFKVKSLEKQLKEIQEKFHQAESKSKEGDLQSAQKCLEKAYTLLNARDFPHVVKELIAGRKIEQTEERAFSASTSDRFEILKAIEKYMKSEKYQKDIKELNKEGTIQLWVPNCESAWNQVALHPDGEGKLATAPKTLVHLFCLLEVIKGSGDGHSANTLIEFNQELGRIVNFIDIDDAKSMGESNEARLFIMWQFGLPQSAQPFERAVLLLFSNPTTLEKIMGQQVFGQISKKSYQKQNERIEKMLAIFAKELTKDKITLTPQEFFFELFGDGEVFIKAKEKGILPLKFFGYGVRNHEYLLNET